MMKPDEEIVLPILRGDIILNEAPPEPEGAPTWTLYDPAANKYYKIGWLEFECLVRFKTCQTAKQLVAKIRQETTLDPDEETVGALVMFLIHNHLVQASGQGAVQHFETKREKQQRPLWERILHGYLFFTVPLFKPQAFLSKTYPYVKFLLTRQFMALMTILFAYGVYLSISRIDELATTFMNYLNFEGVVLLMITTVFAKLIHELGHAYMATKYGVPVTSMGLAFIVLYPVLYTETTNAWKLQSRSDRIYIAAGGLMAEFAVSAIALVLWHYLAPGIAQSLCFMLAIVSLAASLAINTSPLMRFDGYYLFSDLVGIDNLQDRSFAFAKWRLRKILWGWNDSPPEAVSREREDFLCTFGFATWIYRFFLYVGIAVLVNHIFFQPLGLILMGVELAFFIAFPVLRELKVWLERHHELTVSLRGKVLILLAGLAFMLLFVPFRSSIEIPAVMHAQNYARFYPPVAAKVEEVLVTQGQAVEKDQILFRLSSPELDYNLKIVSRRLKDLTAIRASSQATPELAKKRMMIDSEIERTRKELEGFEEIKNRLLIKAPFAGQMKEVEQALHSDQWIDTNMLLGLLADDTSRVLSGYVREQDMEKLPEQGKGAFYVEYSPFRKFPAFVKDVDKTASYEVFWPELSSVYGGPVPAEMSRDGTIKPLPRHTIYAVRFDLAEAAAGSAIPDFAARGTVHLSGDRESLYNILIRNTVSGFIRESGL